MALAAERGFQPTGFDYDQRVVAESRRRGLDAHCAEFEEFLASRQEGEFEVLTLFDVLEHSPEPAWFLRRLRRLLRPGGHIALTMPNALRPLPFGREEHDYPPHHFTRWTPAALKSFLEREGFTVVRQNSRDLPLRYLSDHLFFYCLMPVALALVRRILLKSTGGGRTISEDYAAAAAGAGGILSDKGRRQRIVDAARFCFQMLAAPVSVVWRAYYRLRQPESGGCLYTLARAR
jgi:SAM-dependent methyltransferase